MALRFSPMTLVRVRAISADGSLKITVERPLRLVTDLSAKKLTAKRLKLFRNGLTGIHAEAKPVLKKQYKPGKAQPDPLHGRYEMIDHGKFTVVEYEPDTNLRDIEQIPLLEEGGIEAFFNREVLPYAPDAWIDTGKTLIGYEISFTRHFYKPTPMRGSYQG